RARFVLARGRLGLGRSGGFVDRGGASQDRGDRSHPYRARPELHRRYCTRGGAVEIISSRFRNLFRHLPKRRSSGYVGRNKVASRAHSSESHSSGHGLASRKVARYSAWYSVYFPKKKRSSGRSTRRPTSSPSSPIDGRHSRSSRRTAPKKPWSGCAS